MATIILRIQQKKIRTFWGGSSNAAGRPQIKDGSRFAALNRHEPWQTEFLFFAAWQISAEFFLCAQLSGGTHQRGGSAQGKEVVSSGRGAAAIPMCLM
jgi:hypothetical protein